MVVAMETVAAVVRLAAWAGWVVALVAQAVAKVEAREVVWVVARAAASEHPRGLRASKESATHARRCGGRPQRSVVSSGWQLPAASGELERVTLRSAARPTASVMREPPEDDWARVASLSSRLKSSTVFPRPFFLSEFSR